MFFSLPIITLSYSFDHPIEITRENHNSIQNSEIIFQLIEQKGNDLSEILAKVILPFNKILLNENLSLESYISMDSYVKFEPNNLIENEQEKVLAKNIKKIPNDKSNVKKAKVVNVFSKKPKKNEIQPKTDSSINTQMAELRIKICL